MSPSDMDAPYIVYFLEMTSPPIERESGRSQAALQVTPLAASEAALSRWLYRAVGAQWEWDDLNRLSDREWAVRIADPARHTWVGRVGENIVGYFELEAHPPAVKLRYFGLIERWFGQGLGHALLGHAIDAAWALPGTRRLWLHTCMLDHPAALPNYLAQGFRIEFEARFVPESK